jgi:hypothetical protein
MKHRAPSDGGLRAILKPWHWTPIETAMTGAGVPDANCCWQGHEFWVEYKFTAGWAVTLRPEQVGWLLRRSRAGGNSFIAVRRTCAVGRGREAADELWLFRGSQARDLADGSLRSVAPLGYWVGPGPARWPWAEVGAKLAPAARLGPGSPVRPGR